MDSYIETLIIPLEIKGYPVVAIDKGAFANQDIIKDITIPKSVTKIGRFAIGYWGYDNNWGKYDNDVIIHGYKGTAAETYAKQNGFKFIYLDDEPQVTTATTIATQTTTTSTTVSTTATSKATTETTKATTSTTLTTTTSATTVTTNSTTTISTSSSISNSSTSGSTTTASQTTAATTTITTTTNVKGDANGDNKLDVRDAACIAKKLALDKAKELPKWADFNDDGTVNVRDAAAIARYLALRKS